jgi:hypothetical protein
MSTSRIRLLQNISQHRSEPQRLAPATSRATAHIETLMWRDIALVAAAMTAALSFLIWSLS